jgi:hypothetical protein
MYTNNNKVIYSEINKLMNEDNEFKKFKYSDVFKNKWNEMLNRHLDNSNFYVIKNLSDEDQLFIYCYAFNSSLFNFGFSIGYLRYMFNRLNEKLPKLELNYSNGMLTHGDFKCYYSPVNEKIEKVYNDIDNVFLVPMGLDNNTFIVVDGNHRIAKQINDGVNKIKAVYFDFPIAAFSLSNAFEICVYCFLEDFNKIKHNMHKLSHETIYSQLNIKTEKVLNIIEKRNNDGIKLD